VNVSSIKNSVGPRFQILGQRRKRYQGVRHLPLAFINSSPHARPFPSDTVLRMKTEKVVGELLRWRLDLARAEAPPAPSAAHILELTKGRHGKSPDTTPEIHQTPIHNARSNSGI
jgi:hypothetical protein